MTRARSRLAALVVNPVVGGEAAESLQEALSKAGFETTTKETTKEDPGVGQARKAAEDGVDVVLVCGGDGTVRACIEGLHATRTALAVAPVGTGNLLARNLELPEEPREAVRLMDQGGRRRIDVGWINDEVFAVMSGAGLDAAIMRDTSKEAKRRFGTLAYVAAGLRHLRDGRRQVRLEIDGRRAFSGRASTVLVANMGQIGGDVDLFPESDPTDGMLDILLVSADGIRDWLLAAAEALRRRSSGRRIRRWRGRSIVASFGRPVPYELDGEQRPATDRLTFRVEPSSLTVCVDEEGRRR